MKLPYFEFGSSNLCTYCGDIAAARDHVIAVNSQITRNILTSNRQKDFGPITFACISCNNSLSDKSFKTFWDRCLFISNKFSAKARPIRWSLNEIKRLDWSLQTYIEHKRNLNLWYRFRGDWFQSKEFLLNIENLCWEDSLDRHSSKYNEELAHYFHSTINWIRMAAASKRESWND
jgi:hypothetical protein